MRIIINEGNVFQTERRAHENLWRQKTHRKFGNPEAYNSRWVY